jgi:hypothetical protein
MHHITTTAKLGEDVVVEYFLVANVSDVSDVSDV